MTIQEYLREKPLLFDGATGTYIVDRYPQFAQEKCELLNITNPEIILNIHKEYIEAGATAIKTNTFSANSQMLQLEQKEVENVIKKGWQIAEQAIRESDGEHFLFADIGPIPLREDGDYYNSYREIVDVFLSCQAKYFLFETLESSEGIEEIAAYIKERVPDGFVMVSFASSPEGYTRTGFFAEKLFWQMQQAEGIDAVGFNCISGPKHLLEKIKKMPLENAEKYVTVMPNAGYPTMLGKRIYYGKSREYYGKNLLKLVKQGVSIVGGCCGTNPKDIRNARKELDSREFDYAAILQEKKNKKAQLQNENPEEKKKIIGNQNKQNAFAQKLANGEKVIVVELDPPLDADAEFFMEGAARYQCAGVDAIDIADCPIAKARIDSSILACKLTRELGITTIPHMTCRDRNINATKALLLGLNMEGVNNVLTVTGDPVPAAMRNQIKTMFSYNSAILARHIQSFNQEIFTENPFMVSGALNVNAVNFESQIAHAKKKIENGVSVLFTQPVLSERGLENLKYARKELPVKLLGGVMPVVSYRNANFMNNEMAGMDVQDEIIQLYEGKNREEGEELAYRISTRIIDEISDYIDGYYVITPFKRVDLILRIINYIKKKK
ncbi:MAG: bifunctional homocysteine S-methyltransferase/methylenetetrahydrofolate reductase [Butyribacter sp.]|nr:bifunctional homocysteine S-methyltransferase/methylenetetrahydrofolate reductase [bacterium]MDY3855407.1 bifunctional homocysteine S-methyltransferase/methylenetetrahydrofolate reductase [Butyribacter sp.]